MIYTKFFTVEGFLYLSIVRDLYDNSIVAYRTGTEQNNRLVLDTVRDDMEKEKVTGGLALYSDKDFQYTSLEYF